MSTQLRYLTSGESHGQGLLVILEGIPSGLELKKEYINRQLKRRQGGYGRGKRMRIEKDEQRMRILQVCLCLQDLVRVMQILWEG